MNLFCFLLDLCSSELCTMLYLACSQYMPVPLIANRPVTSELNDDLFDERKKEEIPPQYWALEFGNTSLTYKPRVYKEMFCTYDNYKGVLAFKVKTNKNRILEGCSTMTNKVLNRKFEKHSSQSPLANYGQVEMQFDFNFAETQFIPVADVHGYLEGQELKTLMSQFSIFIIHCFTDDVDEAKKIINDNNPNSLIIIVSQDEKMKKPSLNEKALVNGVVEYKICTFENFQREKKLFTQLTKKIYERIRLHTCDWKNYQLNVKERLKKLEKFSRFCLNFNLLSSVSQNFQPINVQHPQNGFGQNYNNEADQNALIISVQMIQDFLDLILANQTELQSERILPMNFSYQKICSNESKIQRDLTLKQNVIKQLRDFNNEERLTIAQKVQGKITEKLQKLLNSQEPYVGVVSIISKLIKSVVNSNMEPLFTERSNLQNQISEPDIQSSEQIKTDIIEKITNINKVIEQSQFSIEFLIREYYIKERILDEQELNNRFQMKQENISYPQYLQFAEQQIKNGQPFEIIDGDNMKFISGVYHQMQNDFESDDEILVISVIGPQSSGKSLLLNTLFGAQFQTSAGRCSKGVYGCLIDIKQQDQTSRFKKILILDTEGIQATQKEDPSFDNRIVFYILCISHIVLVCNKGEMNAQMQETLKIAVYSISQYKSLVTNFPQVNIIMNMIPQIDEQNLDQIYQNLAKSLMEMGRKKNDSHQMINIKKDNVFMLPQAFSHHGTFEDHQIKTPSIIFAKSVEKLNKNLIKFMKDGRQQQMNHTLRSFFEFAAKTWQTINNLHDIDKYTSLNQRQQGMKLQEFINKIIRNQFVNQKDEIKKRVDEIADKELEKYVEYSHFTNNQLQILIDKQLGYYKDEINYKLIHLYQEFCKTEGIEQIIQMMYQKDLQRMINTNLIEWNYAVWEKISKHLQVKSNLRSNKYMQDCLEEELAKSKGKIDENAANQIFEQNWTKMMEQRKKELISEETIIEEVFKDIYDFYKNQVRDFKSHAEDFQLLKEFIESSHNTNSLIQNLEQKHSDDFLYFTGNDKAPEPDKFLERVKKIGIYVPKETYYKQVQTRQLYNWKNVINNHFSFKNFSLNLNYHLKKYFYKFYKTSSPFKNASDIVQFITKQIEQEGQKFQIEITQEFINKLNQIVEYYEKFEGNKQDGTLKQYLDQEMQKIKENFENYFKCIDNLIFKKRPDNFYIFFQSTKNFVKRNYFEMEQVDTSAPNVNQIKQGCVEISVSKTKFIALIEVLESSQSEEVNLTILNYLNQIQNTENFTLQGHENEVVQARQFFFRKLNKNRIIKDIQKVIIENIYRIKDDIRNITDFSNLIESLQSSEDASITQQFCDLDTHLFERICTQVYNIIRNIDIELVPFCMTLSDYGNFSLHQLSQTLITSIYIQLRRLKEQASLFDLEKTKNTEKKLFLAKLTSKDDDSDNSLAQKAAKILFEQIIYKQAKDEQVQAFKIQIKQLDEFFHVQTIIEQIEDYVVRIAIEFERKNFDKDKYLKGILDNLENYENRRSGDLIEKIIDYPGLKERSITWEQIIKMYVNPEEFFEECFTKSWDSQIQPQIETLQFKYKDKIQKSLLELIAYFKKFKELINQKQQTYAINIFIPQIQNSEESQEKTIDDQLFQQTCKKSYSHYLAQVLMMKWDPQNPIQIDGINVKLDINQVLVHQDNLLQKKIPMDQRESLASTLKDQMLSNIKSFVDEIINCFEKLKMSDLLLDQSVLIEGQQHFMREQTRGCKQLCPLCRRKCDILHQEKEDQKIHRFSNSGHQIIGFGGSFHKTNDFAITYGCHELERQDRVFYEGNSAPWEIYKQKFSQNWDFLPSVKNQNFQLEHKENNILIWNLIGPILCRQYRLTIPDCRIQFTKADHNAKRMGQIIKIMYILVLDSSGSMSGTPWGDVLRESKRFLGILSESELIENHTKVSIITYSNDSVLNCEKELPQPELIDKIKYIGGGTNFDSPLLMVEEIAKRNLKDFNIFHVCFLSDGGAPFPKQAIDSIKENKEIIAKFKITAVAFGNDQEAERGLIPIAESFGAKGSYKKALQAEDLKNVLIEMIPVVYNNP